MARFARNAVWGRMLAIFPQRRDRRSPFRRLEQLEDRVVPVTDTWTNLLGGAWSVGSNWSLNAPPTSSEDATVTPGSSVTVTHASGTDTVHTLTSDGSLDISGGSVSVTADISGTINVTGTGVLDLSGTGSTEGNVTLNVSSGATVDLSGSLNNTGQTLTVSGSGTLVMSGTLTGGTIALTNGASMVGDMGTLDGVTVNGNWQVTSDDAMTVTNGLTVNGTLSLGNTSTIGYLNFSGTQTLGGTGIVDFGSSVYTNVNDYYNGLFVTTSGTTLTVGPNLSVSGTLGYIGYFNGEQGSSGGSILNQGTIEANTTGGKITVDGTDNQNVGNLNALYGATLSVSGTWVNTGTVSVDATSLLSLGGTIVGGTIATEAGAAITPAVRSCFGPV